MDDNYSYIFVDNPSRQSRKSRKPSEMNQLEPNFEDIYSHIYLHSSSSISLSSGRLYQDEINSQSHKNLRDEVAYSFAYPEQTENQNKRSNIDQRNSSIKQRLLSYKRNQSGFKGRYEETSKSKSKSKSAQKEKISLTKKSRLANRSSELSSIMPSVRGHYLQAPSNLDSKKDGSKSRGKSKPKSAFGDHHSSKERNRQLAYLGFLKKDSLGSNSRKEVYKASSKGVSKGVGHHRPTSSWVVGGDRAQALKLSGPSIESTVPVSRKNKPLTKDKTTFDFREQETSKIKKKHNTAYGAKVKEAPYKTEGNLALSKVLGKISSKSISEKVFGQEKERTSERKYLETIEIASKTKIKKEKASKILRALFSLLL